MKRKSSTPVRNSMTAYLNILSIDHVKSMSFDALVVHLRNPETIRIAGPCITEVVGACNVRIFLAAYMIAYRPTSVFESMDELSSPLFASAGPVLSAFEEILKNKRSNDDTFHAMAQEYFKCFKTWKVPDSAKLISRIKHALVALYTAEHHLPADEPIDSPLKV